MIITAYKETLAQSEEGGRGEILNTFNKWR